MRFLIVGNGVAGMEAAITLRQRAPDAEITVVSEESDHFFSRTALMYVACGQLAHKDIEPLERDAYARLNLRRVRARATGLRLAERRLVLASGAELPYDRLLLALGSAPRPAPWPGGEAVGVGHLVTLQDLHWFTRELHGDEGFDQPPNPWAHLAATAPGSPYQRRPAAREGRGRPPRRAVVVGGGLIGIEAVEVLLAAKVPTTFVIREEAFWPIALDRREADWVAEALRQHGVDVRLRAEVASLEADEAGCVRAVHTSDGPVDAELVLVAIGVVPQTAWLPEGLARAPGGGIAVDDGLRASDPHVWAAGDCAAVRWPDGALRPEQLWYTGRDQGRVAARAMVGDDITYRRGTWYNSAKLMDVEYTTVGEVSGADVAHETIEETGPVRSLTRFVSRGGALIGFNALGRRWDHSVIRQWIDERRPLPYVFAHLPRAAFDTEFVPPLRVPR